MGIVEYMGAVVGWWALSIVKFIVTPTAMMASPQYSYSFFEIFLITGSGASIGVFIFYNMGEQIFNFIDRHRKKTPRKFTRLTRFITRVKRKYGLKGILIISALISVPISSLLAARYYRSNVTLPLLVMSFWIWALALTAINFGVKLLF